MNPKVSVIIPVFNNSNYIENTLLSLINQTFNDFEVIIINDGSYDDSIEKVDNLLSQSNIPFQIFYQENKGVSTARNKGLDLAKGKYIVFLDGDDYIEIGEKLDKPSKSIDNALQRIRRKVRDTMGR